MVPNGPNDLSQGVQKRKSLELWHSPNDLKKWSIIITLTHDVENMPPQNLWKSGTIFTKPHRDLILNAMGVCSEEDFSIVHLSNIQLPIEVQASSTHSADLYPKMRVTWNKRYEMEVIHEEPLIVPYINALLTSRNSIEKPIQPAVNLSSLKHKSYDE